MSENEPTLVNYMRMRQRTEQRGNNHTAINSVISYLEDLDKRLGKPNVKKLKQNLKDRGII